jgi:hypothetical protein
MRYALLLLFLIKAQNYGKQVIKKCINFCYLSYMCCFSILTVLKNNAFIIGVQRSKYNRKKKN